MRIVNKLYANWKGLNQSMDAIQRSPEYQNTLQNVVIREDGSIAKRPGFKVAVSEYVGSAFGLYSYSYYDTTSQSRVFDLIHASNTAGDTTLSRTSTGTLTISYSGGSTPTIDFKPNSSNVWELVLYENGIAVNTTTYGTGLESSPPTLSTLISDINAVADWSASATRTQSYYGSGNIAAAVIPLMVGAAPGDFSYFHTVPINDDDITYGQVWAKTKDFGPYSRYYSPPSYATLRDVVYMAVTGVQDNREGPILKYDGVTWGVPIWGRTQTCTPSQPSGTTLPNGTYKYKTRPVQKDAKGNKSFGAFTDSSIEITSGPKDITLTFGALDASLNGRDKEGAEIGNFAWSTAYYTSEVATGVTSDTIEVTTPPLLQVGQKVYYDNSLTVRTVTGILTSPDRIVLDASVTVATGDIISNLVTVEIYRTIADGLIYYLVDEIPTGIQSHTYVDSTSDTTLIGNAELVLPVVGTDIVPAASVVTAHQQLLLAAGSTTNPNSLFFSDIESPESFPLSNEIEIPFASEGECTGMISMGDNLLVFKRTERAAIRGDFASGDIFVDVANDGIGCIAQGSIAKGIEGAYFLSRRGPERVVDGELDKSFSSRVRKFLVNSNIDIGNKRGDLGLIPEFSTAVYDPRYKRYLLAIPAGNHTAGESYRDPIPTSSSLFLVYEERTDTFLTWKVPLAMFPTGGMVIHNDTLWFGGGHETTGVEVLFHELKLDDYNSNENYLAADNTEAIEFKVVTSWLHGGILSGWKKFLRLKIWNPEYGVGTFRAFSLAVKTYIGYTLGTAHSSYTETFSSESESSKRHKLKSGKSQAIAVEISNNTLHETASLSGIEIEMAIPYEREQMKDGEI